MDRINEYKVIQGYNGIDLFQTMINNEIKNGWQPLGGITISSLPNDIIDQSNEGTAVNVVYLQALGR